jgi:Fe-Mn family superoxide dismutase
MVSTCTLAQSDVLKGGVVTKHQLPPLPYAYNALEPYYDEVTLRIHHDKHHLAYVNGLNKAEEKLAEARASGDFSLIQYWERQLAFHGAGDVLHTIFWQNMAPNSGGEPTGELMNLIKRDFGSFDNFKKQFSDAAVAIEGNGCAVLGWQPQYQKLYIHTIENHQKQLIPGMQPLLVLDVWEHAYYLKHQNRRADWVENWWHIVNWRDVSERLSAARKV